jgi:hypothetical protein
MSVRVVLWGLVVLLGSALPPASAGGNKAPVLSMEHSHPEGAFRFRTPPDWAVKTFPDLDLMEARGSGSLIRFQHRDGEVGYDSLHVDCMLDRLAAPMDVLAGIDYEYEFVSRLQGTYRVLDSAFVVRYDTPIDGHTEWRQRSVTLVGEGQSLCMTLHVPRRLWKGDKAVKQTVEAVVASLELRQPPAPSSPTP